MESALYLKMVFIIIPLALGLMALFSLTVGMRGILTKRPFMISNRWFLATILAVLIPSILLTVLPLFRGDPAPINWLHWLNALVFGSILLVIPVLWYSLKGYATYGVTDASFREALIAALEKLQLSYEESLSAIRLTSIEADLQVSIQSRMGTGLIKVKQRAHRSYLKEIANAMNEYFGMSSVSINITFCIFSLVTGVFDILIAVAMFFLGRHLTTLLG